MTQALDDERNGRGRQAGVSPIGSGAAATGPGEQTSFFAQFCRIVHSALVRLGAARVWLLALGHGVLFVFIYWLAFGFRLGFNFDEPPGPVVMLRFWASLAWVMGLKIVVFFAAGQYHGWWRYVTFADLVALIRASVLSLILIAAVDYYLPEPHVPRAVLLLDALLSILILGALRSSWRVFREHFWPALRPRDFHWALLVGTDHSAGILAHQIQSNSQLQYRIKGLVATNGEKAKRLGQIPILGPLGRIRQIAESCGATDVLVIAGTLPGGRLRSLIETCNQAGLHLKIIPSLEDRLDGDSRIPIRDIEINDLLRREPVQLDTAAIGRLLEGPDRHGDRGRRQHRLGDLPPGPEVQPQGPGPRRPRREPHLRHRARTRRRARLHGAVHLHRRRRPTRPDAAALRAVPPRGGLPRGRPQARAPDGGQRRRGDQEQRLRHQVRGRPGRRVRRRRASC